VNVRYRFKKGERGHVARRSWHFAANPTPVRENERNYFIGRFKGSIRQHAGRCEQNARAPRINDPA
jgi:hypothetical protein